MNTHGLERRWELPLDDGWHSVGRTFARRASLAVAAFAVLGALLLVVRFPVVAISALSGAAAAYASVVVAHRVYRETVEIPAAKVPVIAPDSEAVHAIAQETGARVSVADEGTTGTVIISSRNRSAVDEAKRRVQLVVDPPAAELGGLYTGEVVNITKFGAFVNILPGKDGLLHISQLGKGKRIGSVEEVLNLGDKVAVRVDEIDQSGRLTLSLLNEGDAPSATGQPQDAIHGEFSEAPEETGLA